MAYQPLRGWVQVTEDLHTGELRSERFHASAACGEDRIAEAIQKAAEKGTQVKSYLTGPVLYADVWRDKGLSICWCAEGRGFPAQENWQPQREVPSAGSQGTGRRR